MELLIHKSLFCENKYVQNSSWRFLMECVSWLVWKLHCIGSTIDLRNRCCMGSSTSWEDGLPRSDTRQWDMRSNSVANRAYLAMTTSRDETAMSRGTFSTGGTECLPSIRTDNETSRTLGQTSTVSSPKVDSPSTTGYRWFNVNSKVCMPLCWCSVQS